MGLRKLYNGISRNIRDKMNYQLMQLKPIGDKRGKLVALESHKNIPFEIKRVYYIYDTSSEQMRGKHAHQNLEQLYIAINGRCEVILDNGKSQESVCLESPDMGLYIGKNIWREIKFFDDCKLMVLASDYYDENEYIRDYEEFLKMIRKA